jgi:endonuclease/exonuclease/phosphatase family metal-dependent hydrolase
VTARLAPPALAIGALLFIAASGCTPPRPVTPGGTSTTPADRPDLALPPAETLPPAPEEVAPPALVLGSWNLRRLGHGEKRLDLAAQVIAAHDVVALQEVMSPAGVHALLEHLPGWDAAISPAAVGRAGYAEHYAVLYRRDAASVTDAFTVDDPADVFTREPFVVCLRSGAFDFCLLTIHVVFGDRVGPRDAEIAALGPLVDELARRGAERDWLLVGDFNRPARTRSFAALAQRGFRMATGERVVPTSLGRTGYKSDYDHLLLDPSATTEWRQDCERVDFVADSCGGDFARCATDVSDHAPIRATFATAGPDDD